MRRAFNADRANNHPLEKARGKNATSAVILRWGSRGALKCQVQSTRVDVGVLGGPAGSLKGQPTVEPRPAAQHPSLGVKLASAVTGRTAGMPSRVLGCPRPRTSRDAAAARRGRTYTRTLHAHLSIHDRDGLRYPRFIYRASTQMVRDGSAPRSRSTADQQCYPTGTPSTRTPSRRRRRRRGV